MKKLTTLALFLSFSAHAQINLGCKDPQVILTLRDVPCKQEIVLPEEFDIPDLEINYDDIELIFERENEEALGADSSGGGHAAPMGTARRAESEFQTNLQYSCEATLISNGEKKYEVLSKKSFTISNTQPAHFIVFNKHYIRDIGQPGEVYPLPNLPANLNTSGFYFSLTNPDKSSARKETKMKIELCRLGMSTTSGSLNICSEKIMPLESTEINLKLKTQSISRDNKLKVTQKVSVACDS